MPINFDFPFILTLLVLLSGAIVLLDRLVWAKGREAEAGKLPLLVDYARSLFPVLLIVWVVRSFIVQPYRVPTGSLEPTVLPGDFIVVKQFSYGLHWPVIHRRLAPVGHPKRGDIALFHWPVDSRIVFVKRVIGVPGDHIVYKNKVLTINGKLIKQGYIGQATDIEPNRRPVAAERRWEQLGRVKHEILVRSTQAQTADYDLIVPRGKYFMMGDNRDNSDDSRIWGFVPESHLIGKAFGIWMSWDANLHRIRWNRVGKCL